MTRASRLIVGAALAGLLLWLVLRDLDGFAFGEALRNLRPEWLVAAFAFYLADYSCRIMRWRFMLQTRNPALGWARCAVPFLGSIAANNVLPFRLGDVLRCFAFSDYLDIASGQITATVLVERLLDLLVVIIILGIALAVLGGEADTAILLRVGPLFIAALGIAALAMLLFPSLLKPLGLLAVKATMLLNARWAERLAGFNAALHSTLAALASGKRMMILIFWSCMIWGLEAAVYWAVAMAVPALAMPAAAWLAMPVGTLATLLPSTPGYIGTLDYSIIATAKFYGNSHAAATAFAFMVHAMLFAPVTLVGGACLLLWSRKRAVNGPVAKAGRG